MLPWWTNVVLATVAYLSFKYWIPSITFQIAFCKGIAMAVPSLCPCRCQATSHRCSSGQHLKLGKKVRCLSGKKGSSTLRTISWQEFEELVGEPHIGEKATR